MNRLTLNEVIVMQLGRNRKIEAELKNTRLIMWSIFQKDNRKKIKPENVLKLPSDKKAETSRVLTKEEYENLNKMWAN